MINLSRKDRSLMLLIAVAMIFLWLLTSLISSVFSNAGFKDSEVAQVQISDGSLWLNSSKAIDSSELKNRIIILHFWSQSCISCNHGIQKLNDFYKKMGDKITIIGVHSAKFTNDKNRAAIKKAVLRHNIEHPIIIDRDDKITKNFQIKEWPSYALFNNNGKLVEKLSGSNSVDEIISKAKNLINRNKFSLESKKLPIILEKNGISTNVLRYPTKIIYVPNFRLRNRQFPALIISDTGKNSIIVSSLKGEIVLKIGSEFQGFSDGNFAKAHFNSPQGIIYDGKNLFIADTANHAIRVADFTTQTVRTLIGSGSIGQKINSEITDSSEIELNSPTDIEFFPSNSQLVIANAGTNQILIFDLNSKNLRPFAGNGSLGNKDGKFPNNSLAQTEDMSAFGDKLYLVDSLSSSLRQIDKDGNLLTLAKGNDPSDKLKDSQNFSLQAPQALFVDDTGIYIADSLSHKIKKYDFASGQLADLFGSVRGNDVGNKLTLDEPRGLVAMLDRMYISDTNNNRIILANRGSKASELLDVIPTSNVQKDAILEFISIAEAEPQIQLKSDQKIIAKIKLSSGWKINEQAPSYLNLLSLKDNESAVLMQNFDWNELKNKQIEIPPIKAGKDYVLQGKIYYCRNSANSLCYVKNYQQTIEASSQSNEIKIEIDLAE